MHVPDDRPLASWIRELYADGRAYVFYKTPEWRALRREVMEDHGFACERHAALGIYRRADTVHHELEVRDYPALALTRYVSQPDGSQREVLHPLCNECHNAVHGRFSGSQRRRRTKPCTEERWD